MSVALGVATAVGLLARLRRWAGLGLLLLWALLCYGNYEHVSANGANMALRHAGYLADETFLRGSALAVTRPWLLVRRVGGCARFRLGGAALGCTRAVANPHNRLRDRSCGARILERIFRDTRLAPNQLRGAKRFVVGSSDRCAAIRSPPRCRNRLHRISMASPWSHSVTRRPMCCS